MSEETTTGTTQEAPKEKVLANIIRGRMPVAVVAQIRFGDQKNEATKTLATMFGTTVGKIDDIKKNRNFSYVKSDFKPTAEQKADGIAWLQRHPDFEKGTVDKLINELQATPEATAEEAAAFTAVRTEARGQSEKTKTGEVADAGGGNKRAKKDKKEKTETATTTEQPNAEDLLS